MQQYISLWHHAFRFSSYKELIKIFILVAANMDQWVFWSRAFGSRSAFSKTCSSNLCHMGQWRFLRCLIVIWVSTFWCAQLCSCHMSCIVWHYVRDCHLVTLDSLPPASLHVIWWWQWEEGGLEMRLLVANLTGFLVGASSAQTVWLKCWTDILFGEWSTAGFFP